ncbi:MAG: hypothetical protein IKC24_08430 [Oscillospiraceae bacterium]|nr:hypothetical protein [Oscillospiraceae bacterium]MBR6677901.1 hypothetical protein [Oscillospiraceae bacterium]
MKCCNKIWKILGAVVAATATILVVVKFWDEILEGVAQLKEKAIALKDEAQGACESEDFLV